MTRRRSRGRGPARCRSCAAPVIFLFSPFTSALRTFDPAPVAPSHPLAGVTAFPVLSRKAYRPAELVEHLQLLRECTSTEAQDEIQDLPWHLIHECRPDTKDTP